MSRHVQWSLLTAFTPLIDSAVARVTDAASRVAASAPQTIDAAACGPMLVVDLLNALCRSCMRTLVLELNVARLQEAIAGATPEERFQHFTRRCQELAVQNALIAEYPVLARLVATQCENWGDAAIELIERLAGDWAAISSSFFDSGSPGAMVAARRVGDVHRHGRAVHILTFASGAQLVYKPRRLSIDLHFQQLLQWCNARGDHPSFRTLRLLDRDRYGWVEFADAGPCQSAAGVARFYQRLGGLLAILYALDAMDFHFENVIASADDPILVDLEALFHPRLGAPPAQPAAVAMVNSVLRVGLLPDRRHPQLQQFDLSALSSVRGTLSPVPMPYWEAAGTDEMRLERKRLELTGGSNVPQFDGRDADVFAHVEDMTDGFVSVYRTLIRHRDQLLAADGPIERFADDDVRVVMRATRVYAGLLHESAHPDVLRDSLDRERLLDHLWTRPCAQPLSAALVDAEQRALLDGDIPVFVTTPASTDIWANGEVRAAGFLHEASLTAVRRRIGSFDDNDLETQSQMIRGAIACLAPAGAPFARPRSKRGGSGTWRTPLDVAEAVAYQLRRSAIDAGGEPTWIGFTHVNEDSRILSPLGLTLYDGLAGVALFLGHAGSTLGIDAYTQLARRVITALLRQLHIARATSLPVGGYSGWGGMFHTLCQLGTLWGDERLLTESDMLATTLTEAIDGDRHFDVIVGTAGCLLGVLNVYNCRPSQAVLDAAIRCGNHLLDHRQSAGEGVAWRSPASERPLAGFSHGAAGIALALLRLGTVTGDRRYTETAADAIAYEQGLFRPEAANWVDLRHLGAPEDGAETYMTAWCHGAPGIGLARLATLSYHDNAKIRTDIAVALRTTAAHGFSFNHSLCHGGSGNLETLLTAADVFASGDLRTQVVAATDELINSMNEQGWMCGVPLGIETPGLMTGLAGIGYQMLRIADPGRVPRILTLDLATVPGS